MAKTTLAPAVYNHKYHPDDVILLKNWHIGKMTPLSQINTPVHDINKVTHDINPDIVNSGWTHQNINPNTRYKNCNGQQPKIKTSLLMPSDIQVHRQVPLNNVNISEETKLALQKLLNTFDSIISRSKNDIGQTDLIKMHIAMRPDSTPVTARPYPLALKDPDFLQQEIKKLLDAGIICKYMSK